MGFGKSKKKYLIGLTSGLGNQMFQFCLYQYLRNTYDCTLIPIKEFLGEHNGLEISRIFPYIDKHINYNISLDRAIYIKLCGKALTNRYYSVVLKIISRFIPYQLVLFPQWKTYTFLNEIKKLDSIFNFPAFDPKNEDIKRLMQTRNSISIHVRRGDYQSVPKWRINLGDICDIDYYNKSLEYVYSIVKDPLFFIFSDDIKWVKDNLNITSESIYIDWNHGKESYRDLQLMTYCKYNICANSTFSLLAAWLNKNKEVQRIVPLKWSSRKSDKLFQKYIAESDNSWHVIDNDIPKVTLLFTELDSISKDDIKNISNQSYEDFEVIVPKNITIGIDRRFKYDLNIKGKYVLKNPIISSFKDKNYIKKWFLNILTNEK